MVGRYHGQQPPNRCMDIAKPIFTALSNGEATYQHTIVAPLPSRDGDGSCGQDIVSIECPDFMTIRDVQVILPVHAMAQYVERSV